MNTIVTLTSLLNNVRVSMRYDGEQWSAEDDRLELVVRDLNLTPRLSFCETTSAFIDRVMPFLSFLGWQISVEGDEVAERDMPAP